MEGEGFKWRVKGRFMAAFNKVLFRCKRKCQVNAGGSKHRSSRPLAKPRQDSFYSDGQETVLYLGGDMLNSDAGTGQSDRGDSIVNTDPGGSENAPSRERIPSAVGPLTVQAAEAGPALPGQASQAIVQRYVARARDQGVSLQAGGPPQEESSRATLPLVESGPGTVPPVEGSSSEIEEPVEESPLACPPVESFPAPLPGKDLNVLLCTVATHMWIAESASELEMLGEMVDVLVRGGASEFLPAIIKGCWAASLSRSGVNLHQKVALFSKMVREGARLLSPDELHEALRVASMACACVWADREKAGRPAGGCPVRALLEVIRVLIRWGCVGVESMCILMIAHLAFFGLW